MLDEARLDGRDERGMGIEHPARRDLALEAQLRAVGRQEQLDGRGGVAESVVERLHAVGGVDAFQGHIGKDHRQQEQAHDR